MRDMTHSIGQNCMAMMVLTRNMHLFPPTKALSTIEEGGHGETSVGKPRTQVRIGEVGEITGDVETPLPEAERTHLHLMARFRAVIIVDRSSIGEMHFLILIVLMMDVDIFLGLQMSILNLTSIYTRF